MRITKFTAKNFMRLEVVEITPDGAMVDIQGPNKQGKTSVLDGIWALLAGADHIPSKPIRRGEQNAVLVAELGDQKVELIVTRTFATKKEGGYTTQLIVAAPDGARYAKPQAILDAMIGALSFDPTIFTSMSPKDQVDQLRALVPDVDFEAIDRANRRDFETRTEINRDLKAMMARLMGLVVPGDPRQVRVDESALLAELEAAGDVKAEIEKERSRRAGVMSTAEQHRERVATLGDRARQKNNEIVELQQRMDRAREVYDSLVQSISVERTAAEALEEAAGQWPPLVDAPDTSALKARIDAARKTNADITERERVIEERARIEADIEAAEARADTLTAAIEKRDDSKAAAIASASLPVDGLSFGDSEVLFNGLPLDQASDAERMSVSVALAAALNPKLKVIRMREGNNLDRKSTRELAALAEKHGLQIWREVVSDDAKSGIILEDGRLKLAEVAA